ncbi:hypothetical protein KAW64_13040 [bacterium]|nr:hypothetical protein [bacterium]
MRRLSATFAILVLCASVASARMTDVEPGTELRRPSRGNEVLWFDDIEGNVDGWYSVSFWTWGCPRFHLDTYMAYEDSLSWWCGSFDYDADGGYGNSWDERLNMPTADWTGYAYPVLTFAFRCDSEAGYDFTYVQAESNGVFVNLNYGYDGTRPWLDLGLYGYVVRRHDNPFVGRLRFVSDGAWSDEDGLYCSTGGAFMVDNVRLYDYYTGYTFFLDDCESGGLCYPTTSPWQPCSLWHVIEDPEPAFSDPRCWWCGYDETPEQLPPNLTDGLYTPFVDLSSVTACTCHFAIHFAIPTVDNDYVSYRVTCDGSTYYQIGAYWGDFGTLDGWDDTAYNVGFDVGQFCPSDDLTLGRFLWTMYTTDNGCGPGAAGDAGVMIDDVWMEGPSASATRETSWGEIKAMYR